jgi:hypothetical protein
MPDDVAEVIRAADKTEARLSEAEFAGVQIIDRLDPDTRRKLLDHIEAGKA